jgi:predicted ArsR family transcriptional regulator
VTSAPTPDDLPRYGERVREAERALDLARAERDEAIRHVRRTTTLTARQIADRVGLSEHAVKTVLRGLIVRGTR